MIVPPPSIANPRCLRCYLSCLRPRGVPFIQQPPRCPHVRKLMASAGTHKYFIPVLPTTTLTASSVYVSVSLSLLFYYGFKIMQRKSGATAEQRQAWENTAKQAWTGQSTALTLGRYAIVFCTFFNYSNACCIFRICLSLLF